MGKPVLILMILYFFIKALTYFIKIVGRQDWGICWTCKDSPKSFYQKFLKLFFGRYQTRAKSCSSYQSWWPPRSFWLFQLFVLFPSGLSDTTRSVPNLTPLRTPVTFLSQGAFSACFLKLHYQLFFLKLFLLVKFHCLSENIIFIVFF